MNLMEQLHNSRSWLNEPGFATSSLPSLSTCWSAPRHPQEPPCRRRRGTSRTRRHNDDKGLGIASLVALLSAANSEVVPFRLSSWLTRSGRSGFYGRFGRAEDLNLGIFINVHPSRRRQVESHGVVVTGGAILTWWVLPLMLAAGFATPWPYNYWRLNAFGKACH